MCIRDRSAFGGTRFRLVLVGTNQGWLHAFGEVTKTDAAGRVTGAVQELWSFLPTDFLANLNYLKDNGNAHRFMVDGTPVIYHLDLPPSGGGRGNGVVDSAERAVAIFGLRKGGRSYYALDIHDPFNPTLKWSLVPDEAASLTADRIATGGPTLDAAKALLAKAGFSTSTPAFGRIQDSSLVLRDAVFLGGGASNAEVDAQFSSTKLGRFVLALDAYSGQLLAAADLTAASAGGATVGPVASMVPFEFITNSGMAQRAYFTDSTGGLWAWGSKDTVATAPYTNFRKDTSKLDSWALRKVYQDDNVGNGARYTTLPAPFRVASYPVRAAAGSAVPAAVGIALVSGDRNNPLDRSYAAGTNPAPTNHRLTVVFDRQDSRAWGFDTAGGPDTGIGTTNLRNFTANEVTSTPGTLCTDSLFKLITPGCDDYYLAPKTGTPSFGYYVAFPSAASGTGFVAKGINPPLVVAGSLFYSLHPRDLQRLHRGQRDHQQLAYHRCDEPHRHRHPVRAVHYQRPQKYLVGSGLGLPGPGHPVRAPGGHEGGQRCRCLEGHCRRHGGVPDHLGHLRHGALPQGPGVAHGALRAAEVPV